MTAPTDAELLALLDRLDTEPADALESPVLDFKLASDGKKLTETACEYACCFANATGGTVVFGVADRVIGRSTAVRGVPHIDAEGLRQAVFNGTVPALDVQVSPLDVPEGSGRLLVMRVAASADGPHGTTAGVFKQRVGKACMPLSPQAFVRSRVGSGALDWSGEPAAAATMTDLDPVQIARARTVLGARAPDSDLLTLSDGGFLQGLEAVRHGAVTHTGLLLFGRADVLARTLPQAQVHYVHQPDETAVARNDLLRLPLLEALERIEAAFQGPLNPETEVNVGFFKLRIPQFPLEGVREAVLNAVTHRDYLAAGEVLVRHTPDELVVRSPGGFVDGISPDNILRHEPVARNRTLANAFVRLRLVEAAGVGRHRIFRSALVYGKRRPMYASTPDSVTLRLFNRGTRPELAALVSDLSRQGAPVKLDTLLVLDALCSQPYLDTSTAAEVLQRSREEARAVLDAMADASVALLERKGRPSSATFHLAKNVATLLRGKAAYTRLRGIDPIRYAEMARQFLNHHRTLTSRELRELLALGDSPSARVEASRLLARWSAEGGFIERSGRRGSYVYRLRKQSD